jgi:secreted trypsin-like serine protease
VVSNTSDLGIVVLDEAVDLGYAAIAPLGTLDGLAIQRGKQETSFTVVGYGLQSVKPTLMADRVRLTAEVQLINLRSSLTDGFNLHHTNAKGTGGGTCFGDSGGPVFLSGTTTIVGVTSFGPSKNCTGNGFAYRTDTQAAQGFIYSFL